MSCDFVFGRQRSSDRCLGGPFTKYTDRFVTVVHLFLKTGNLKRKGYNYHRPWMYYLHWVSGQWTVYLLPNWRLPRPVLLVVGCQVASKNSPVDLTKLTLFQYFEKRQCLHNIGSFLCAAILFFRNVFKLFPDQMYDFRIRRCSFSASRYATPFLKSDTLNTHNLDLIANISVLLRQKQNNYDFLKRFLLEFCHKFLI